MYYVFDSRDITVEEIHTRPGSQYLGFMGDTLIGYCERNDSIFLIDYPTKQTIQSVIYPNDYLKILKYVGRLGLFSSNTRFAIGPHGRLAYVDQEKEGITLVRSKSDSLSIENVQIEYDHGLFLWADTNNLLVANVHIIDPHGTEAFDVMVYNCETKKISHSFPLENGYVDGVFYRSGKDFLFEQENKLKVGKDFQESKEIISLPDEIQYVYEAIPLGENKFIVLSETRNFGNHFLIMIKIDES